MNVNTIADIKDLLQSCYPDKPAIVASVGGSGTWAMDMAGPGFPEGMPEAGVKTAVAFRQVQTPFGPIPIVKILIIDGFPVIRIPVHGWRFPIPNLNHTNATFWLLFHLGIKKVIVDASVGGIKAKPWDVVVPDDVFINDEAKLKILELTREIDSDPRKRMAEPFCPTLRQCLITAVKRLPDRQEVFPHAPLANLHEKGTYYTMPLTVFETPAEIKDLKKRGFLVVGQSSGQEALAARLCGMHFAVVNPVVNFAEGLEGASWSAGETMADLYTRIAPTMGLVVIEALKLILRAKTNCRCSEYASATDLTVFTNSATYQE